MCFCSPKQSKKFDFVSTSKNIFNFCFRNEIYLYGNKETNQRFYFACEKKTTTDIFLLAERKPKLFLCLRKLKIQNLFWT